MVFETTKGEPFQILGFESADKTALQMFELRAEPIDSTLLRWNISMSLSPSAPFGPFVREFKVVAKPPAPSTSFQVRGTVFGPVKVEPAQLHFLVVNKGRVATKTIFVRNSHAGFPLKISNVRLLDPRDNRALAGGPAVPLATEAKDHLVWNIKETDPGKVAAIEVIVKETMPQMSFNAVLAFDTGVPGSSLNGSGRCGCSSRGWCGEPRARAHRRPIVSIGLRLGRIGDPVAEGRVAAPEGRPRCRASMGIRSPSAPRSGRTARRVRHGVP